MTITVRGYEEIQAANMRILEGMKPDGALGRAVLYATRALQQGTASRAHRDTGTLAASQMAEVQGLQGRVYTADNANPKSGDLASVYGPFEEARGGDHAFYNQTMESDAPTILEVAGAQIVRELYR